MIQKILLGVVIGVFMGMLIVSVVSPEQTKFVELFFSEITTTSMITGFLCGIYDYFTKSKMQVFLISIFIGSAVFFIKFLITYQNYDANSLTMGAFSGAIIGVFFAFIKKVKYSIKLYNRLKKIKKSGIY